MFDQGCAHSPPYNRRHHVDDVGYFTTRPTLIFWHSEVRES
ncbi:MULTISPECIES: hypothetical protein [Nocardiaceae]|nr:MULTISPECIES: hypothetical protein [Rhodococcus]